MADGSVEDGGATETGVLVAVRTSAGPLAGVAVAVVTLADVGTAAGVRVAIGMGVGALVSAGVDVGLAPVDGATADAQPTMTVRVSSQVIQRRISRIVVSSIPEALIAMRAQSAPNVTASPGKAVKPMPWRTVTLPGLDYSTVSLSCDFINIAPNEVS
jgi:hypothetical protein